MNTTGSRLPKRGPAPGAEPEEVLAIARRRFLSGEAFDTSAIAAEAGIGRTTLWRWFGDRDTMLGELLGTLSAEMVARIARRTRKRGVERYLTILERFFEEATTSPPLLALLRSDPVGTVGILMAPQGRVYPRLVEATEGVIEQVIRCDAVRFAVEPAVLANLTVEIGMVHLWANILAGQAPDVGRALQAARALATLERPTQ